MTSSPISSRISGLVLLVAAVFLVIGLASAWVSRRTPLLGNLFVALIALVVFAVIYTS